MSRALCLPIHYNGLTNVGDYSNTSIPRLVVDTYLYVIKEWWNPQTFRSRFVGLANMALLLLAAATLLWLLAAKIKQNRTLLLLIVLFLLFPFGINVVYFISKGMEHTLMTFSFSLLYLLAVLFLREIPLIARHKSICTMPLMPLWDLASGVMSSMPTKVI